MNPWLTLGITILVFLFLEGFLSGSEIALVAANRKRLNYLAVLIPELLA